MSKRSPSKDLLTIEESALILGCGVDKVRKYVDNGKLKRVRESTGELRFQRGAVEYLANYEAYIRELVAKAPPFSRAQIDALSTILNSGTPTPTGPPPPPTPQQLALRELVKLKEEASKLPKLMADALASCGLCDLPSVAHSVQKQHGFFHDYEPKTPDQVMKVARKYKRLIAKAEQKIKEAETAIENEEP